MQSQLSRVARRRQEGQVWTAMFSREAWGFLLLAGVSLVVGALFQDPVRYGWLVGAVAMMLLVRMALRAEAPEEAEERSALPVAPVWAYLRGVGGLAAAGLLYWLVPPVYLTASWALLGLGLVLLGRGRGEYPLRFAGVAAVLLAAGHMVAVDSFPNFPGVPPNLTLGGVLLRFQALRQIGFAVAGLSGLTALFAYRAGSGERQVRDWLMVVSHLAILWAVTFEIADAIQMTRGAASAGNEALLIAAAWGGYGLLLVLTAPLAPPALSWAKLGQAVFTFAIGFLLMGGLVAQARWADASARFAAYGGVPVAIWIAAWVQHRRGRLTEADRLLALAALAMGFGILSFEAKRWLEPLFTYPGGTTVTLAMLERDQRLLGGVALGAWSLYSLLAFWVGLRLRSRPLRFMGVVLAASTGLYLLFWLVL